MFDYRLMEALVAVVAEGGFERAARRLHITQSAVSQRLKQLEEQAGQLLLIRTTPPTPTDAGRQMIRHLSKVQRLEADLNDDLNLGDRADFTSLPVGVNADSLDTWFLEAVRLFLQRESVVLDLKVDDQEQTHRLLREGNVLGCVSSEARPMQGCRAEYLGCMPYRLMAHPDFARRWFPDGLTAPAVAAAPAVLFTRQDRLHQQALDQEVVGAPSPQFIHYVPAFDPFCRMLLDGVAYGALPVQQSESLMAAEALVDLTRGRTVPVYLYWHCWTIQSRLLTAFSKELVSGARRLLCQDEPV